MKRAIVITACGLTACLLSSVGPIRAQAGDAHPATWDRQAAAAYLDQRLIAWSKWPNAARDHETFCVSCHTVAPYGLARPALGRDLGEQAPSIGQVTLVGNVTRRVELWNEVEPFYPDQTRGLPKTSESRGTEAVLDALVLASADQQRGVLSSTTRRAFDNLWALQMKTGDLSGAWAWLNFHYEPWESDSSAYYGATLAAIAVTSAPGYAATSSVQAPMKSLAAYLRGHVDKESLFNRAMALVASAAWPDLLTPAGRQSILDDILRAQQEDGGWSTASLGMWKRRDGTMLDTRSDGYATGLMALAMKRLGTSDAHAQLERALTWLAANQNHSTGGWSAVSLNKERDPATEPSHFMSDAATAYAVLALVDGRR